MSDFNPGDLLGVQPRGRARR